LATALATGVHSLAKLKSYVRSERALTRSQGLIFRTPLLSLLRVIWAGTAAGKQLHKTVTVVQSGAGRSKRQLMTAQTANQRLLGSPEDALPTHDIDHRECLLGGGRSSGPRSVGTLTGGMRT
jgi:hypothetical protein